MDSRPTLTFSDKGAAHTVYSAKEQLLKGQLSLQTEKNQAAMARAKFHRREVNAAGNAFKIALSKLLRHSTNGMSPELNFKNYASLHETMAKVKQKYKCAAELLQTSLQEQLKENSRTATLGAQIKSIGELREHSRRVADFKQETKQIEEVLEAIIVTKSREDLETNVTVSNNATDYAGFQQYSLQQYSPLAVGFCAPEVNFQGSVTPTIGNTHSHQERNHNPPPTSQEESEQSELSKEINLTYTVQGVEYELFLNEGVNGLRVHVSANDTSSLTNLRKAHSEIQRELSKKGIVIDTIVSERLG